MARQGLTIRNSVLKETEHLTLKIEITVGVLDQEPRFVGSLLADQADS